MSCSCDCEYECKRDCGCDYNCESERKRNKLQKVSETCTVRAWMTYLQEIERANPDAVVACKDSVMHVNNANRQIWNRKHGSYDDSFRCNLSKDSLEHFNVLYVEKDSNSEHLIINRILTRQDGELDQNQEPDLRIFLDSLKDLTANEQLEAVRSNTRFRETLYFFPDSQMWYTREEVTGMCGGKLYYNFDSLFSEDERANFILVSKLPFEAVSTSILIDPVQDLLRKYSSDNSKEGFSIEVSRRE